MWKLFIVITCLIGYCATGPVGSKHHVRFKARQNRDAPLAETETATSTTSSSTSSSARLNLPSNATSIRAEIKDGFSCEGRVYGYYADMENDCQIFHVCMPVAYGDGKEHYFRWSFICPEDTIFSQDSFTCMHRQDMLIDCAESMKYYELNRNFGQMNDDSAATAHRNSPEPQAAASENYNESEAAIVEENVTPKPVKKTKPFHRKPVRTSAFTQKPKKPQATEVEQVEVKVKRPAAAVYKRNKPQILRDRTTEEPVKEVSTTQPTNKIELNTEANSEVLLDTLESTTAQVLAEEPLVTSTLPTLTEEEENFLKQSAGGFQEVDPTMAAEAEALINDFLQTMMKKETEPVAPLDVPVPVPDSSPVAEEEAVVQEVADFGQTTLAPIRSDIYEIPVTIIHTPLEEIMAEKPQAETVKPFRPISIDDVVKSVKEHLDKPVETEVIAADSTDSLKPTSEVNSENDEKIVPIYHRLKGDQDKVEKPEMISVEAINDLTQTADKSETESQSTNNPENAN